MHVSGYAIATAKNRNGLHPRGYCMCEHQEAIKIFRRFYPRGGRLERFIGYTSMYDNKPNIQTSPRWCPRTYKEKKA